MEQQKVIEGYQNEQMKEIKEEIKQKLNAVVNPDALIPYNLDGMCEVSVHYELPTGGGTGIEYRDKLLKKESKWYSVQRDNSELNVHGWIRYKLNRPVLINGFAITSANDCVHRDPKSFRLLVKKLGEEHPDREN